MKDIAGIVGGAFLAAIMLIGVVSSAAWLYGLTTGVHVQSVRHMPLADEAVPDEPQTVESRLLELLAAKERSSNASYAEWCRGASIQRQIDAIVGTSK